MGASCSFLHLTPSPDMQPITDLIVPVSLQGDQVFVSDFCEAIPCATRNGWERWKGLGLVVSRVSDPERGLQASARQGAFREEAGQRYLCREGPGKGTAEALWVGAPA